jgi:hypothetical protein
VLAAPSAGRLLWDGVGGDPEPLSDLRQDRQPPPSRATHAVPHGRHVPVPSHNRFDVPNPDRPPDMNLRHSCFPVHLRAGRQVPHQPRDPLHAALAIVRQGPHQPCHRFHTDNRGFVFTVSGLGPASAGFVRQDSGLGPAPAGFVRQDSGLGPAPAGFVCRVRRAGPALCQAIGSGLCVQPSVPTRGAVELPAPTAWRRPIDQPNCQGSPDHNQPY